jgi:hypothetical protein
MNEKLKILNDEVKKYETEFMTKNKDTFLYDVLNLKTEKEPTTIPKAKNGRPDSIFQYYYYRDHFFDGIDFKDDRIVRTPFFDDRIKKYFESIILQHPDTVLQEVNYFWVILLINTNKAKLWASIKCLFVLPNVILLPTRLKVVRSKHTTTKLLKKLPSV